MDDNTDTERGLVAAEQQHNLPAEALPPELTKAMPIALALYLNDALYTRVSSVAVRMAKAAGVTPAHLVGKPEACFAVVSRAVTWRLDPFAVAMCTYQTPGGQIGFEGKLIHAIIENSGYLDPTAGGIRYEHYGDWSKVQGKFAIKESSKTDNSGKARTYAAPTWTDDHAREGKPADQAKFPFAQSCGVRVSAKLRGEREPRILDFDLIQAQPRNSTLWATDPMTQICYTAVRRFGSVAVPALLMGVPFDPVDNAYNQGEIDVTPKADKFASLDAAIDAASKSEPAKSERGTVHGATGAAVGAGALFDDPKFTFAQVARKINAAADGDSYNLAVDMIRSVADKAQRDELTAMATKRREAIESGARG